MKSSWSRLVVALLLATAAYAYATEAIDPNLNVLTQVARLVARPNYVFYSGSEGGFYILIGKYLDSTSRTSSVSIVHHKTSGSAENVSQVWGAKRSFGLVNKDSLSQGDFLYKNVDFKTPLFTERLHVLYRHDLFRESLLSRGQPIQDRAKILMRADPGNQTRQFLEDGAVSMGPHDSGTRQIAGFVLDAAQISPQNALALSANEALSELTTANRSTGLRAVFLMAAAPMEGIQRLLEKYPIRADPEAKQTEIGLMAIDGAVQAVLNPEYGLEMRRATFPSEYTGGRSVATLGSYAWLIASKDVLAGATQEVLFRIEEFSRTPEGRPLREFDFYSAYLKDQRGSAPSLIGNLLFFVVSVTIVTAVIMALFVVAAYGLRRMTTPERSDKLTSSRGVHNDPHVFVSYIRDNWEIVQPLCEELEKNGICVWLDRRDIIPGQRWQAAVREAIKGGAFFLACFSKEYAAREVTYMNEELTIAIEELRKRPTDRVWFLPILLSECKIPERMISLSESISDIQWIEYYADPEAGLRRLLAAIRGGQ